LVKNKCIKIKHGNKLNQEDKAELGLVDNFEYGNFENLTSKKCLKSGGT